MVDHITDTQTFTISVILHGSCSIMNIVKPTQVEANTPFVITYDCKNLGATDTCYGKVIIDGAVVPGTRWDASITASATRNCTANIPGIAATKSISIEVGYTTA